MLVGQRGPHLPEPRDPVRESRRLAGRAALDVEARQPSVPAAANRRASLARALRPGCDVAGAGRGDDADDPRALVGQPQSARRARGRGPGNRARQARLDERLRERRGVRGRPGRSGGESPRRASRRGTRGPGGAGSRTGARPGPDRRRPLSRRRALRSVPVRPGSRSGGGRRRGAGPDESRGTRPPAGERTGRRRADDGGGDDARRDRPRRRRLDTAPDAPARCRAPGRGRQGLSHRSRDGARRSPAPGLVARVAGDRDAPSRPPAPRGDARAPPASTSASAGCASRRSAGRARGS